SIKQEPMNPTDLILSNFEKVSSIPRGTKYEAGIRNWLITWAKENNCPSKADAAGNLVIYVPASKGYEDHPTLILQGHMDMVWQKTNESTHNFEHDPIQLIREGDWIRADGTTLGADNGIGIALMMSIVEDASVKHPPLELLLTVEEEMGVVGADKLDPSLLSGKTLINLDSETEGVFTVGCAGGGSVNITLPVTWDLQQQGEVAFELKVSGLQGGHSGEDINKFRANANKLLARLLDEIQRNFPIRLSTLKGGTARNAIPREAESIFVCATDKKESCKEIFAVFQAAIQNELAKTETGLVLSLNEIKGESVCVISQAETQAAIHLLMALPHGVSSMSAEMPAFVETSNNIGVMELKEDGLSIISNQRSSVFSRLEEITRRVETVAWLAGAKTERTKMFPPWQPNMESPLLKQCVETYRSIKEEDPKVELTHGGLECGIISDRCGGLDTISMGPTIKDLHSPDERLYVPSLATTWEFLRTLQSSFAACQ
ncbi:MAG: aminoacyl-histidine dipeptidase, partial [Chloroflexi bacterium]|nr:aminoacyl-histidine dipeptidase [Chloroflexota bacterium]